MVKKGKKMSKVLHMIDFDDLITYRHEQFLIEKGMNENDGLEWCEKDERYVEIEVGTHNYDDIPSRELSKKSFRSTRDY